VSGFGILTLAVIGGVLMTDKAHFISEEYAGPEGLEEAKKTAYDCFAAIAIYGLFLIFCGARVMSMSRKPQDKLLDDAQ